MSAKATQTDGGNEAETNPVEAAYEAVGEALQQLDMTEHRGRWISLQRHYFDLRAAVLARDEEFQTVDLGGTDLYVPTAHRPGVDNPTVADELGEVELPTRGDNFRVLDGVQVANPLNPHVTHAVTIDHVIETDGEVRLEVNALPLESVGKHQGSHIQ